MVDERKNFELKNRREAGFSLIELLISMIVFIIFSGVVYGLLQIAHIQKGSVNSQTEVVKNLRLSLNTIGRDAVNAGLGYDRIGGNMPDNLTTLRMGLPADTNTTQDLLTAVISGNDINTNTLPPGNQKTDVVAFAFQDKTFNGGNTMPITNSAVYNTTDVTLTAVPTGTTPDDLPNQYDLYFVSEGDRSAMAFVTTKTNNTTLHLEIGAADPLKINSPFNGTTDSKSRLTKCAAPTQTGCMNFATATAKKIFWVSYSVTSDGTLVRTTYGNNHAAGATAAKQIQIQPIAYNVQNFQVRYLMRDGTYTDNPSNGGTNQLALNNVVQIEVTISSRITIEENGVSIQKTVDLKSTFSTKNLNYDAS